MPSRRKNGLSPCRPGRRHKGRMAAVAGPVLTNFATLFPACGDRDATGGPYLLLNAGRTGASRRSKTMKTLSKIVLSATAAASVLAAVPASAQSFGYNDGRGRTEQVRTRTVVRQDVRQMGRQDYRQNQFQARRWNRGERFDSRYAQNYRVITNPRAYRLHDAPRGYRWVRSGNDAVLVAVASGLIGAIIGNSF